LVDLDLDFVNVEPEKIAILKEDLHSIAWGTLEKVEPGYWDIVVSFPEQEVYRNRSDFVERSREEVPLEEDQYTFAKSQWGQR
jgi:hypothetical protein